ncbi:MAG: acetyl-CoA carboxylase biotin carboxyl carrier protein subunit [Chloroflexi bacterium]|nr:acetyl-CoA carboxylase biotin carboxyl carrier protein subunit [Chloroflexota bacterium]
MSRLMVKIDGRSFTVELDTFSRNGDAFTAKVNGKTVSVKVPEPDKPVEKMDWMIIGELPYELVFDTDMSWLRAYSGMHHLDIRDMEAVVTRPRSGDGRVKAPIPGLISRILVEPGTEVKVGQPVIVLEAMKMENEIRAPRSGTVTSLHVETGDSVVRNEVLVDIQ